MSIYSLHQRRCGSALVEEEHSQKFIDLIGALYIHVTSGVAGIMAELTGILADDGIGSQHDLCVHSQLSRRTGLAGVLGSSATKALLTTGKLVRYKTTCQTKDTMAQLGSNSWTAV